VQLQVPADTPLQGRCLAEIALPEEFLVIHIQRAGKNILPHGDTYLEPNDVVTFLVRENEVSRLEDFWKKVQNPDENASAE
jgi:Trk K+ transport system NAD-binding subunit